MILAIDGGNSNIVLGCFDEHNKILSTQRIPTLKSETEFGYATKIKEVLSLCNIDINDINGAIICSAVPEIITTLKKAINLLTKVKIIVVDSKTKTNLKINPKYKNNIGADLIAAAVATKENYKLPAIIIDMGTATTLTVVDEKGEFLGGAIMPGLNISREALSQKTSLLPNVDLSSPGKAISLDTVTCIQSGIVYGNASMIDGMIDKFKLEMAMQPKSIIATGGVSRIVIPNCKKRIKIDDDLLIKGLQIIWNLNN